MHSEGRSKKLNEICHLKIFSISSKTHETRTQCCWRVSSPSSGGSQLTLASQCESRKVMTSPLALAAPSRRVLISPSLFLVLRMRTFGSRTMYSSSGTFRCSEEAQTGAAMIEGGRRGADATVQTPGKFSCTDMKAPLQNCSQIARALTQVIKREETPARGRMLRSQAVPLGRHITTHHPKLGSEFCFHAYFLHNYFMFKRIQHINKLAGCLLEKKTYKDIKSYRYTKRENERKHESVKHGAIHFPPYCPSYHRQESILP